MPSPLALLMNSLLSFSFILPNGLCILLHCCLWPMVQSLLLGYYRGSIISVSLFLFSWRRWLVHTISLQFVAVLATTCHLLLVLLLLLLLCSYFCCCGLCWCNNYHHISPAAFWVCCSLTIRTIFRWARVNYTISILSNPLQ